MSDDQVDTAALTQELLGLLRRQDDKESELARSWRLLQVYAFWCVRLPATQSHLASVLRTETPGEFGFFELMLEANQELRQSGEDFTSKIYPDITSLAQAVLTFAKDASSEGMGLFSVIVDALDNGDEAAARADLADLLELANKNADEARRVQETLAEYRSGLVQTVSKLEEVDKMIEADEKTSSATIDRISAPLGVEGSLLTLIKLRSEARKRYDSDVAIASTTPAYGWALPFGTIAAAIVAGVYGDMAVQEMKKIRDKDEEINNASEQLAAANATRLVAELADRGVHQSITWTDTAIEQAGKIQSAWRTIASTLRKEVQEKIERSQHRAGRSVERFLTAADGALAGLVPMLDDLLAEPYVSFLNDELSLTELAQQVAAASQNP